MFRAHPRVPRGPSSGSPRREPKLTDPGSSGVSYLNRPEASTTLPFAPPRRPAA